MYFSLSELFTSFDFDNLYMYKSIKWKSTHINKYTMGKKNKKKSNKYKADARGYCTTATSSSSSSSSRVTLTPKAHSKLEKLLLLDSKDSSGNNNHNNKQDSAIHQTPKVFRKEDDPFLSSSSTQKKLVKLIPFLMNLTFTPEQIVACLGSLLVSIANGNSDNTKINEECALDWLCLNISVENLPALFIDVDVKNDHLEVQSSMDLQVVKNNAQVSCGTEQN